MSLGAVVNPYQPIVGLTGIGLNAGSLYIGVDGSDPQVSPQQCYWDDAGTIPATQPIDILGGYPMRLGTPTRVYTAGLYSIRVRDSAGVQVFYEAHAVPSSGSGSTGNVYSTIAAAQAASIPAEALAVSLQGRGTVGDGGASLWKRVVSQPVHDGKFRSADRFLPNGSTSSANGGWWQYVPDERGVNVRAFGATSDTYTTPSLNRAGIQAAIDYCIYFNTTAQPYIPAGSYTLNDWIHVGYGDRLHSCRPSGDGPAFAESTAFAGTQLIFTALDRPGVCIAGGRHYALKDIAIFGQNRQWFITNDLLGYNTPPLVDDLLIANYFNPALVNPNTRYTPYAAIVIDGFAGAQPATHYPAVSYPAWTGVSGQYNKNAPSNVGDLENLQIVGWGYALAIQPSNFNGNGDFVHLTRVNASYCAGIVTCGNNQGRAMIAENCGFAVFHTAYINGVHGMQEGQLDLVSVQTDYGRAIQIFDVNSQIGPSKFVGGYCEALYRFGNFGTLNTDTNPPLTIDGMKFTLASIQNDFRGYPVTFLDAREPNSIEIANCSFTSYNGFLPFGGLAHGYVWRSNRVFNKGEGLSLTQTYEQLAHDATAGGVVFMPNSQLVTRPMEFLSLFSPVDLSTGAYGSATSVPRVMRSRRSKPLCVHGRWAEPFNNEGDAVPTPKAWQTAGALASAFASVTLVNGVLTLVFNTLSDYTAMRYGPSPGDILWHDSSRLFFRVRSRVTTTVIAEITTGFNYVGGTFSGGVNTGGTKTPLVTFSNTAGNFYVCNCRMFRPSNYLQADSTLGSSILTVAGNAQGTFTFRTTEVIAGDQVFEDQTLDNNIDTAVALITAVAATTITLSPGGCRRTEGRFKLPFLIRQPPANV